MSDNSTPKPQGLAGRLKLGGLDADAVARAEAALKNLAGNFDQWMREELGRLEAARDRVVAEGYDAATGQNLYHRAHDIKGLGTTYGYPLVTRIASSLCELMHDPETRLKVPSALLVAHVEAISASVHQDIRSDNDPRGKALAEELEKQAERYAHAA